MDSDFYKKNRVLITLFSALLVLGHLLFEYFHGGVVTHYLLQNDSLPGISNWWGLLSFPLITWIVLFRIEKRNSSSERNSSNSSIILYRFISGLIFGIMASYLFSIESSILDYIMLGLFILSFFIPLHFGEYLIGYTVGTIYVFGANIPIIGGFVLILIFFILYKVPRLLFRFVRSKFN